jgi:hypothetical protein
VQNNRIYSAPSLSEVIKQMVQYRATGVLTIWRATAAGQEDIRIRVIIDQGHPIYVYRGSQRESATESILAWVNSWGEIQFSFQSAEDRLRLPPPQLAPQGDQANSSGAQTKSPSQAENQPGKPFPPSAGRTRELPILPDMLRQAELRPPAPTSSRSQNTALENIIATLTTYGREYAATNLPRYDRMIFLLINGRRTVSDLSQLTKRPQEEVFASLQRLRNLQLITIETA